MVIESGELIESGEAPTAYHYLIKKIIIIK